MKRGPPTLFNSPEGLREEAVRLRGHKPVFHDGAAGSPRHAARPRHAFRSACVHEKVGERGPTAAVPGESTRVMGRVTAVAASDERYQDHGTEDRPSAPDECSGYHRTAMRTTPSPKEREELPLTGGREDLEGTGGRDSSSGLWAGLWAWSPSYGSTRSSTGPRRGTTGALPGDSDTMWPRFRSTPASSSPFRSSPEAWRRGGPCSCPSPSWASW
jgi:hypothetical protein